MVISNMRSPPLAPFFVNYALHGLAASMIRPSLGGACMCPLPLWPVCNLQLHLLAWLVFKDFYVVITQMYVLYVLF